MAVWSAAFDLFPAGKDYGSVTCEAIRTTKAEAKTRFSEQHNWSNLASPVCTHKEGECTVVLMDDESPTALNLVGALGCNYTDSVLYRDRGAGLGFEAICGLDHESLLNLTDEDCHIQYVKCSGGSPTVTDVTVSAGYVLTGLSTSAVDYSGAEIMPYGLHIGTDVSGGAKHDDNVITTTPYMHLSPYDKIVTDTESSSGVVSIGAGSYHEWKIGRYAFMPIAESDMTDWLKLQPLFDATPPDDWIGGFTFHNDGLVFSRTLHMTAQLLGSA